ncbi:MAG: hypothetical protein A2Y94_01730 [Caldithrix sp. RBG_13_44_9]|nr:MAG: hypothetical protein A2Y94_01730 [Caldithrix sp. RBG_13_44_9]
MVNQLYDEETKNLRRLQLMVDLTIQILYQTADLSLLEGLRHIQNAKNFALALFPTKAETFDLLYKPRLLRVLKERGIIDFSLN